VTDSSARMSALIGGIYDAVVDPQLWPLALETIRQHFDLYFVALGATNITTGASIVNASTALDPVYLAALPTYGADIPTLWGGSEKLAQFPLEEPIVNTTVTPLEVIEGTRLFQEWAQPLGVIDQIGMAVARDSTTFGHLSLSVHESSRYPGEAELEGLRLIAPHLRRAVTISRMLEIATTAATTFEAALEATRSAIVLVDTDLTIRHANRAATDMLRQGDAIHSGGSRLNLQQELLPNQLESAVQTAARDEARLGRRGIGIPARSKSGAPVAVNVMPLERRRLPRPMGRVAAAVFIGDSVAPERLPEAAMRLLYDLTPAEERIFDLVVGGASTDEIADRLAIAPSTVRTHLLHVFEKTGRHNRSELVRLANEIALPTF
jgi:DNA-binding CsgD family transcriptional regulator